jgi:hypothetical protein
MVTRLDLETTTETPDETEIGVEHQPEAAMNVPKESVSVLVRSEPLQIAHHLEKKRKPLGPLFVVNLLQGDPSLRSRNRITGRSLLRIGHTAPRALP